jgi:RNA polymerase sigma factor (sigma-70 family)
LPRQKVLTPERARLAELHTGVARVAVFTFIKRKHTPMHKWPTIEWDDAHQVGLEALCHAARTWSPASGPFPGYAFHRIWFSMIDWLRREGPHSRAGVQRASFFTTSWVEENGSDDEGPPTEIILRDHLQEDFTDTLLGRMFLQDMLKNLSDREAYVLTELYSRGTAERVLASKLGVSESRISQIKARALTKLRRSDDVLATALS